jgi:ABC-2 type transport system permease protein
MTGAAVGRAPVRCALRGFAAQMRESGLSPFAIVGTALSPIAYGIVVIAGYGHPTGALLLGCVGAGIWGSLYQQGTVIVVQERNWGTLQSLAASPAPIAVPIFGRLLAAGCQALAAAPLIALVVGALFGGIQRFQLGLWLVALGILALGTVGMALFLAGALARYRYSAGMVNGLFGTVLVLGGFFMPLSALPAAVRVIGSLLPTALAVQAVRPATAHPWLDLLGAAALSAAWIAAGGWYLSRAQRRLRKTGSYRH